MPDGADDRDKLTGKVNRATLPAQRGTSQEPGAPTVRPGPTFREKIRQQDLLREQQRAELVFSELRLSFGRIYGPGAVTGSTAGREVRVLVVSAADMDAAQDRDNRRQWEAVYRVLFGAAKANFDRKFSIAQRTSGGAFARSYATVPARFGDLHPADARLIVPFPSPHRIAGMWAAEEGTIFLKFRHWDPGTLAHEMSHCYTSGPWDDVQLLLAAWDLGRSGSRMDEGVAGTFADVVIDAWLPVPASPPGKSSTFRMDFLVDNGISSGVGDYGVPVRDAASKFLAAVDDLDAAQWAFFGGQVSLAIDPGRLGASVLTVYHKRVRLDRVLLEMS